MYAVG